MLDFKKRIEIIMNCLCVYDHSMRLKMSTILIDIKLFGKTWTIHELLLLDICHGLETIYMYMHFNTKQIHLRINKNYALLSKWAKCNACFNYKTK